MRKALRVNLRLLHQHGVQIAVGSDMLADSSLGEILYIHRLGAFDNRTLLKL